MAERKKLEVTILPQNFTETQQEQARKNISAAAISATVSKIESSDGTVSAIPYTAEDGSIRYDLKVSATPVISDTEIYGTNGISAKYRFIYFPFILHRCSCRYSPQNRSSPWAAPVSPGPTGLRPQSGRSRNPPPPDCADWF